MSVVPPGTPGPDAPAEPLAAIGGVTTAASAALAVLVAFGLHITDDQKAAIIGAIAVLAPIVVTVLGRAKVFSPKTVRELVTAAATRRQQQ